MMRYLHRLAVLIVLRLGCAAQGNYTVLQDEDRPTMFLMSNWTMSFNRTLEFCAVHNSSLAVLDTADKYNYVRALLKMAALSPTTSFFVNARQVAGSDYRWASGVPVNTTFWTSSHPNVDRPHVQLKAMNDGVYELTTVSETVDKQALCELPSVQPDRAFPEVMNISDGATRTPYFMSTVEYDVKGTRDFCRRHSGELIVLDASAKFEHVSHLLRLYSQLLDRFYVGAELKAGGGLVYEWSNGAVLNTSFWGTDPYSDKPYVQLKYKNGAFGLATAYGTYPRGALCEYWTQTYQSSSLGVNYLMPATSSVISESIRTPSTSGASTVLQEIVSSYIFLTSNSAFDAEFASATATNSPRTSAFTKSIYAEDLFTSEVELSANSTHIADMTSSGTTKLALTTSSVSAQPSVTSVYLEDIFPSAFEFTVTMSDDYESFLKTTHSIDVISAMSNELKGSSVEIGILVSNSNTFDASLDVHVVDMLMTSNDFLIASNGPVYALSILTETIDMLESTYPDIGQQIIRVESNIYYTNSDTSDVRSLNMTVALQDVIVTSSAFDMTSDLYNNLLQTPARVQAAGMTFGVSSLASVTSDIVVPTASLPVSMMPDIVVPTAPLPVSMTPDLVVPTAPLSVSMTPDIVVPTAPLPVSMTPDLVVSTAPLSVSMTPDIVVPTAPLPISMTPDIIVPTAPLPVSMTPDLVVPTAPLSVSMMPDIVVPTAPLPDVTEPFFNQLSTAVPMYENTCDNCMALDFETYMDISPSVYAGSFGTREQFGEASVFDASTTIFVSPSFSPHIASPSLASLPFELLAVSFSATPGDSDLFYTSTPFTFEPTASIAMGVSAGVLTETSLAAYPFSVSPVIASPSTATEVSSYLVNTTPEATNPAATTTTPPALPLSTGPPQVVSNSSTTTVPASSNIFSTTSPVAANSFATLKGTVTSTASLLSAVWNFSTPSISTTPSRSTVSGTTFNASAFTNTTSARSFSVTNKPTTRTSRTSSTFSSSTPPLLSSSPSRPTKCRCVQTQGASATNRTSMSATLTAARLKAARESLGLVLDKRNLSSATRKLCSASDSRGSSQAAGVLAVLLLATLFLAFLGLDLIGHFSPAVTQDGGRGAGGGGGGNGMGARVVIVPRLRLRLRNFSV